MHIFEAKVASRGYHEYKNTTWRNASAGESIIVETETSRASRRIDPYACAIRVKHFYFDH